MENRVATTAQRLRQYMDETGMRQVDILNACKPFFEERGLVLNKPVLSMYVNGKNEPESERLHCLSLGMNVSEVWLMGFDVPKDRVSVPELPRANKDLAFGWMELYATKEELLQVIKFAAYKLTELESENK